MTHTLEPSVMQALKDIFEKVIPEIAHDGDCQSVEDWAQAITFDIDRNELGRDAYGNLVYGIVRDETVQDILELVLQALNEMFDEHQPNMRRTEAHGQYLPY